MKTFNLLFLMVLLCTPALTGQQFGSHALKTGVALGLNQGSEEMGIGALVTAGYQKSLWKSRLRINPYLLTANFWPFGITDIRDQFYRATSIGFNGYLDILRYHGASIFIGAGGWVNYTRGLLGTGGWPEEGNHWSEYLFKLYYGGYFGGGFRLDLPGRRIAWEFSPFNFHLGNNQFLMSYLKLGIDIRLGPEI
jgi:hypothetical protein